jgi:hypothetical protein
MPKTLREVLDWYTRHIPENQMVAFFYGKIGAIRYRRGSRELEFIGKNGDGVIDVNYLPLDEIELANESPIAIKMIDERKNVSGGSFNKKFEKEGYELRLEILERVGL